MVTHCVIDAGPLIEYRMHWLLNLAMPKMASTLRIVNLVYFLDIRNGDATDTALVVAHCGLQRLMMSPVYAVRVEDLECMRCSWCLLFCTFCSRLTKTSLRLSLDRMTGSGQLLSFTLVPRYHNIPSILSPFVGGWQTYGSNPREVCSLITSFRKCQRSGMMVIWLYVDRVVYRELRIGPW